MTTNAVAAYMSKKRISVNDLAAELGVSKSYASLLKDGHKPVTVRIARKLSELTGKPWADFIDERHGVLQAGSGGVAAQ